MKTTILAFLILGLGGLSSTASEIPEGRLGHPLGKYLEIEGVRAGLERGKVGVNTLLVHRIQDKELSEPIGIWIENVDALPEGTKILLRGYESGKMIGLPHEVAEKENIPLPQAGWQFYRYFLVTSVVTPNDLTIKK